MKQLDLAPHHPIQLRNIDHVKFWFERNEVPDGPSYFPDFDIKIIQTDVTEKNAAIMFSVESNDALPDYVIEALKESDEGKGAVPAVKFGMTSIALFEWMPDGDGAEPLRQFIEADTALLISWPYVRAFIGDFVSRSGLPPYHLPLLQIRTKKTVEGTEQEQTSTSVDAHQ